IDPFRLVEQRILLCGDMPVKQFPRLKKLLSDNTGVAQVNLTFDRTDMTNLPIITGHIQCELALTCQRCLGAVPFSVKSHLNIILIKKDAEAERLQGDYDTWLVEDDRIFLQDFIEDEILLVLPHSALHDECEPFKPLIEALPNEAEPQQQEKNNPFAILKDLKN
ncbi:MAG: DUF177 domain-containing protein, partial [Cocleimonas sp.]|nr:DUF177 domain-containing protein [Cocleimonas sp.]